VRAHPGPAPGGPRRPPAAGVTPAHAAGAADGRRWRTVLVMVLALAAAAVVALLLAQSAGAVHLPVLGGAGAGPAAPRPPAHPAGG
jgi:hypothetical protein